MKNKSNFYTLLLLTLLIFAGTISPSNAIDEGMSKTPWELISTMLEIVAVTIMVYIMWNELISFRMKKKKINPIFNNNSINNQ